MLVVSETVAQRERRRRTSQAWLIGRAWDGVADDTPYDQRPPLPRAAQCGWTIGRPGIDTRTATCGSLWACPVCAPGVRYGRQLEVARILDGWKRAGGAALLLNLTMSHTRDQPLDLTLNASLRAWSHVVSGPPWERKRQWYGIEGVVRASEITWNARHGWHPHIHALIFLDKHLTEPRRDLFAEWLHQRWTTGVTTHGGRTPNRQNGLHLETVDDRPSIETATRITRADLKTSRTKQTPRSYTPFELLDYPKGVPASNLWCEYVDATRGRLAITWSRHLRETIITTRQGEPTP